MGESRMAEPPSGLKTNSLTRNPNEIPMSKPRCKNAKATTDAGFEVLR
jgi:hypothetical protein